MRACCRSHRALEEAGALVRRVAPEGGGGGGRGKGWQRHKALGARGSYEFERAIVSCFTLMRFLSLKVVSCCQLTILSNVPGYPCAIRSGTCPGTQKKVKSPVLSRWLLAVPLHLAFPHPASTPLRAPPRPHPSAATHELGGSPPPARALESAITGVPGAISC